MTPLRSSVARRPLILLALLLTFAAIARPVPAHDVPDEIVLRAFVKPQNEQLDFLVRVPLALLEGVALPKRGPGYLDLARIDDDLDRAAGAVARTFRLLENGNALVPDRAAMRISQPSEDAFGSFEEARAHISGPALPDTANVFWNQGYFDVWLNYALTSAEPDLALEMMNVGLPGRVKLFVEYLPPDGGGHLYEVHGDFGRLELDPSWYGAAATFVGLGTEHILDGIDHLLFLFCLVLPFGLRHAWSLLAVITSFTIAHSITLIAAATGAVPAGEWFPPLVETLIALSIVYMALENIVMAWLGEKAEHHLRWRWLITGGFGLVHGFGFSFVLTEELQLAGEHVLLSLLAFNLGVELGQGLVLLVVLPLLALALRTALARKIGVVILSALVVNTAWDWMLERMEAMQYVRWPELAEVWPLALTLVVAASIVAGATLAARNLRKPGRQPAP